MGIILLLERSTVKDNSLGFGEMFFAELVQYMVLPNLPCHHVTGAVHVPDVSIPTTYSRFFYARAITSPRRL
jgi:hypothetical protein